MLTSIEGIYQNGQVVLTESPSHIKNETRVIVTFLDTSLVDLRTRGISESEAATLRANFATFAEDWESEEMEMYDHYETFQAQL